MIFSTPAYILIIPTEPRPAIDNDTSFLELSQRITKADPTPVAIRAISKRFQMPVPIIWITRGFDSMMASSLFRMSMSFTL